MEDGAVLQQFRDRWWKIKMLKNSKKSKRDRVEIKKSIEQGGRVLCKDMNHIFSKSHSLYIGEELKIFQVPWPKYRSRRGSKFF